MEIDTQEGSFIKEKEEKCRNPYCISENAEVISFKFGMQGMVFEGNKICKFGNTVYVVYLAVILIWWFGESQVNRQI